MGWFVRPISRSQWRATSAGIVGAALALSVALLAWRIPAGWEGGQGHFGSGVPLRPATADEVATWMQVSRLEAIDPSMLGDLPGPGAWLAEVGGEELTIHSRLYSYRFPGEREDRLEVISWSGNVVEHHLHRSDLEAAFGQLPARSQPPGEWRVIYRSDHWAGYAFAELVLLTALFTIGITLWRVLGWALRPLAIETWLAAWWIVASALGLSFVEANFFHQRVVGDDLAVAGGLVAILLAPFAVLVPASALAVTAWRALGHRLGGRAIARAAPIAATVPPLILLVGAWATWAYRISAAQARAQRAADRLDPEVLAQLSSGGDALANVQCSRPPNRRLDSDAHAEPEAGPTGWLDAPRTDEQRSLCAQVLALRWAPVRRVGGPPLPWVFVPLGNRRYLEVWKDDLETQAHVRELPDDDFTIDSAPVEEAARTGRPAHTPFREFFLGGWSFLKPHLGATVPIVSEGKVVGVVYAWWD